MQRNGEVGTMTAPIPRITSYTLRPVQNPRPNAIIKTCIQCGARWAFDADGNLFPGTQPGCSH